MTKIRTFKTGATRNTEEGKLDFEAYFSPAVLERRAQYMKKHTIQSDGKSRSGDNWQHLFGDEHYNVCMKSALRHLHHWWTAHRTNPKPGEDIEEAICALMFNAEAYLFKLLQEKK